MVGTDVVAFGLLVGFRLRWVLITQRLHSSSFLGFPYRILNMNPKKEPLWSLRVGAFNNYREFKGTLLSRPFSSSARAGHSHARSWLKAAVWMSKS